MFTAALFIITKTCEMSKKMCLSVYIRNIWKYNGILFNYKLNTKKTNNPINNGRRTWVDTSPKRTYKVNRHTERCSMSLIIREMQIKSTMRYHLTPVRMVITNKSTNNKFWWGCGEKGKHSALLVGMQTGAATVESSMEITQKIKNESAICPVIPFWEYIQRNTKH